MISCKVRVALRFALAVSALLLVAYLIHFRDRWAVAGYQRQLVAAGEKLKIEQLWQLPPLPESNGAPLFSQTIWSWSSATNLLDKNSLLAMHMVAPGKAMVGWDQPDISSEQTNTWAEMEAALSQFGGSLDLVRAAAEHPIFDFQLDYRLGPCLPLPHLGPLKRSVQRLTTAALCDLHRGDVAAAVADIQVMLALVKATTDEHLAISQLVRIAMAHIAFTATWELLQSPNLMDEQLAAVQRDWTELKFIEPAEDSLVLERAFGQMTLEQMRDSRAEFAQILYLWSSGPVNSRSSIGQKGDAFLREVFVGAKQTYWHLFLSYPDQLRSLKGHQVLLDSFRLVRARQSFNVALHRQPARLAELGLESRNDEFGPFFDPSGPDLRSIFSQSVVSLSRMLNRVLAVAVAREMAIAALALKRYQLRHGHYPDDLSALVPEFFGAVPRDPADGQPLRYHLKPDGTFLLYSIGEDCADNGGDASPAVKSESFNWQKGRDLVWPSPATLEEVKAYRQRTAKKHGQ